MMTNRDLVATILGDHRLVRSFFLEADSTPGERELHRIYFELRNELTAQMRAEEKVFYPLLHRKKHDRALVDQLAKHHREIEGAFSVLDVTASDHTDWKKHFQHLRELVDHHFEKEEGLFEKLRAPYTYDELLQFGAKYVEEKLKGAAPAQRAG